MKELRTIPELLQWRTSVGTSVGFVPTMGALHEGHLSLIKMAKAQCESTVASIFVNPTQFNDPKDFQGYPTDLQTDIDLLRQADVDAVFLPNAEMMYPDSYQFKITENSLSHLLCGAFRPGHFDGVLTIVMKLLQLVQPKSCFMGEKDYQQFLLVKKMADAFFQRTEIVPCPTVREPDGLAMSSRNRLLSKQDREIAPLLYHTLKTATDLQAGRQALQDAGFQVEYFEEHFNRRFVAAKLGSVRLIDNVAL